jgi:hypothetical protein
LQNVKELYILGQPIETEIGKLHFVKVKDYPKLLRYVPYIDIEKNDILREIAKIDKEIANSIKDLSFLTLIKELRNVFDIYNVYEEMFLFLFRDDVFDKVESDEQLNELKKLIRKMNNIPYEEKNPNPEIQRFNDLKKLYNQRKSAGGGITFEAIYTSVEVETGENPDDMTIYKMYALFSRISQFKNYDTTILYNSVSGKVDIEVWYKHIDLLDNEAKKTTLEEFSRNATQYIK